MGSKGYGLIFNNNSNISLIPYYLFTQLVAYYKSFEEVVVGPINTQDEYQELIIYAYIKDYEYLHFILENMDISIPLKYYLTEKEETQKYGMRFISRKDQEYIVFGKDLIDIMEIEFEGKIISLFIIMNLFQHLVIMNNYLYLIIIKEILHYYILESNKIFRYI